MAEISYENDVTGSLQKVRGSDNRLNVSSRSDARAFYVSRDNGQSYVLRIEDDDAATNDLIAYIRNDATDGRRLFIQDIHVSCEFAATIKVAFGDAVAATGTTVTPVNLNKGSTNDATVTALGNGAVGGVGASTFIATGRVGANDLLELNFNDALILGQNDSVVVELDLIGTSPGDIELDIFFFLE